MDIDTTKSLEELENSYWGEEDTYETSLIETIYKIRKKPLNQLTPGDIGYFVRQSMGNKYIVPLALNILEENPYIEVACFEGDLLFNVLDIKIGYWKENNELFGQLARIMEKFNNGMEKFNNDYPVEIMGGLITKQEQEEFNNKWINLQNTLTLELNT